MHKQTVEGLKANDAHVLFVSILIYFKKNAHVEIVLWSMLKLFSVILFPSDSQHQLSGIHARSRQRWCVRRGKSVEANTFGRARWGVFILYRGRKIRDPSVYRCIYSLLSVAAAVLS